MASQLPSFFRIGSYEINLEFVEWWEDTGTSLLLSIHKHIPGSTRVLLEFFEPERSEGLAFLSGAKDFFFTTGSRGFNKLDTAYAFRDGTTWLLFPHFGTPPILSAAEVATIDDLFSLASQNTSLTIPTITSISPSSGSFAGGTNFTLTGSGFQVGATVSIGGSLATNIVVVSDTTITGTTPGGVVGFRNVAIRNPDGTERVALGAFRYLTFAPTFGSISPSSGPSGQAFTISGTNFRAGATVEFGVGNFATNVTVVDAQTITGVTPFGSGVVDVIVTMPDDQKAIGFSAFAYLGVQWLPLIPDTYLRLRQVGRIAY